jgi:hypothetical protein
MQRTEPPEARPRQIEIEGREGKLPGDDVAHKEPGEPPEYGCDYARADHPVGIASLGSRLAPLYHLGQNIEESEARGAEATNIRGIS